MEKINVEMFIIPNGLRKPSEFGCFSEIRSKETFEMLELNNMSSCTSNQKLVQIWTVSELSDNMSCHRFHYNGNDILFPEFFPTDLFRGKKEGDTFDMKVPLENGDIMLCEVRLAQLDYRYRNFGRFEDLLEKLGG